MGENVLAAIQEYTRVLASDPAAPQASDAGSSVYFDIWGRFMVRVRQLLLQLLQLLQAGSCGRRTCCRGAAVQDSIAWAGVRPFLPLRYH